MTSPIEGRLPCSNPGRIWFGVAAACHIVVVGFRAGGGGPWCFEEADSSIITLTSIWCARMWVYGGARVCVCVRTGAEVTIARLGSDISTFEQELTGLCFNLVLRLDSVMKSSILQLCLKPLASGCNTSQHRNNSSQYYTSSFTTKVAKSIATRRTRL